MIVNIGAVYKVADVEFLVTIDRINPPTQTVMLRFVNLTNWISIGGKSGNQLTNGHINCLDLDADKVELVAPTIAAYFNKRET